MKVRIVSNNCVEIVTAEGVYLQSYRTVVAKVSGGEEVTLDPNWDCSTTTTKHVTKFLNERPKEIRDKLMSGEYIISDLNKEL